MPPDSQHQDWLQNKNGVENRLLGHGHDGKRRGGKETPVLV